MSFPPYERYRDSGVEWLGEVPSHWESAPFWALFRRTKRTGFPDAELLSVYRDYGVIRKADRDDNFNNPSEDLAAYQLVENGDLAMNKMKAWQGSLGISKFRGIVSPAYFVFQTVREEHSAYLHYLLRSPPFAAAFMTISKGIRINQWDIDPDHLSQLPVPLPSRAEQVAIAAFLDRETAKIDALVEAQRRLIELLKEKRQAVIAHTVTKGLDPTVLMKDSGVEWLGEVPAHWEVKPLMRLTAPGRPIMYGIVLPGPNAEMGVPIVKGGDVKPHRLRLSLLNWTTPEIEAPFARARLRPGDIVYSIRGSIGDAEPVPDELLDANITQDVARISPSAEVCGRWLLQVMKSKPVFVQLEQGSLGAAVRGINIFDLKRAKIPVPPRAEQEGIAAWLKPVVSELDLLAAEAATGIELLEERRAALISAAVTGKIDVRGWTAADVRKAVAAEIIYLHARKPTFGRVKNQKLLYLAETHAGVSEIGGRYERKAAGPYDGELIAAVERELEGTGMMSVSQPDGPGSTVSYAANRSWKPDRERLQAMLGDRLVAFEQVNVKLADLDTRGAEAVATLYAVWNDALIDGEVCDDARLIRGFLDEWHPEKREKFRTAELQNWLDWMRRNGLVPKGHGPRTGAKGLFG